jgi:hypothetical protein
LGDIELFKTPATIEIGFRFIHKNMLEVFLRINELSFVFVVVSRLAHRITLILAVTSACFLNLAAPVAAW